MTILKINNLGVEFGGVAALQDVRLDVQAATIHGLIGPNGAGKTTLLNCISRAIEPSAGEITFEGRNVLACPPDAIAGLGIARTFQNLALVDGAAVIENVMAGLIARRPKLRVIDFLPLPARAKDDAAERLEAYNTLKLLGLTEYAMHPVGSLSYGIRKTVEIGRALCAQPKLLMLDEPTAGLNPAEMERLSILLRDLRTATGLTILVITHHIEFLMGVANKVTVLDLGKVIASGEPGLVRSNPAVISAYLGDQE